MLSHEDLGERVRGHRHRLGLTQETLADRAGVSTETIGRLEQAVGTPTLVTVYKVAEAMGLTGSALIAENVRDEVSGIVNGLPEHEQQIAFAMLRALSAHMSTL
jgi:transcriptional regulator with XRE-family HTH domain